MTFKRNAKLFVISYGYTIAACVIALIVALKVNKLLGLAVLMLMIFGFILVLNRRASKC